MGKLKPERSTRPYKPLTFTPHCCEPIQAGYLPANRPHNRTHDRSPTNPTGNPTTPTHPRNDSSSTGRIQSPRESNLSAHPQQHLQKHCRRTIRRSRYYSHSRTDGTLFQRSTHYLCRHRTRHSSGKIGHCPLNTCIPAPSIPPQPSANNPLLATASSSSGRHH